MGKYSQIFIYILEAFERIIKLLLYRRRITNLVKQLRKKEEIRVLFVLSEISLWKTEGLYKEMLNHPRFRPIIGTCLISADTPTEAIRKYHALIDYLSKKDYQYVEIYDLKKDKIDADIVFYQEPYDNVISPGVFYHSLINSNSLICDAHYAMRAMAITRQNKWLIDAELYRYCWQMYVENELTAEFGKVSLLKGKNIVITGMPIQDELLKDKKELSDPWKKQMHPKKRIIYAPHHTIPNEFNLINLSCFLDVCDFMLEMAEKYADKIQFAFKPHPFLKKKLYVHWGKEKTDAYYQKWATMENSQLSEGEYIGLFAYSDAMIHDCDSFTIEYTFMKKPILFLIKPEQEKARRNNLNKFGQMAFDLHDKGFSKDDIEKFILKTIAGDDKLKLERESFYNNYLLPPYGNSASENIINAILGEKEYSNR
ncbi:CDP-glycerol glycerophosphotransferase family protein [Bacteroides sp.]|uniref:CDP-glycerol glycerophosphotransferase family protein n=1 Tax=Bacteroides sp. TaxID=29523 RepID=UPI0025882EAA|nr:CDP-glycerol glycerophosphotransferase family protein [Bacteroides sp.]